MIRAPAAKSQCVEDIVHRDEKYILAEECMSCKKAQREGAGAEKKEDK